MDDDDDNDNDNDADSRRQNFGFRVFDFFFGFCSSGGNDPFYFR